VWLTGPDFQAINHHVAIAKTLESDPCGIIACKKMQQLTQFGTRANLTTSQSGANFFGFDAIVVTRSHGLDIAT
jgi:hypothetical protein